MDAENLGLIECKKCRDFEMCAECKEKYDNFCIEIMSDFYEEEKKFYEEQKRITDRIIKGILAVKGSLWTDRLLEYCKELGVHDPFKIVRKPKGKVQECDEPMFVNEWVDQSTGYECDDYYGNVTIKIDEKRYLEMPFHS